jgi:serine/threonine protein kinase
MVSRKMSGPHLTPRHRHDQSTEGHAEVDGRYTIEDEISRGGMSRVLRVRHRELDKPMALKLLGEAADGDARAAFYREARIAASLDHPHIVQVYDFGEDPERGLYLVMELLAGESAAHRLAREGSLLPIAAVDIALQTVEALDYLHGRGLVHGDVKPGHLFLSPPRTAHASGRAREARRTHVSLLDFGLARPSSPHRRPAARRHVEGTPSYLAPEIVSGAPPSPSSDLYALGASLFELLAGRAPFQGTLGEVMSGHLRDPVPSLLKLRGSLPGVLDAVVQALMAKQPAQRPADARTVSHSLRACVSALGGRRRASPRQHPRSLVTEAIVDGMPLGVFIANRAGVILFSNPALDRLLGMAGDRSAPGSADEIRLGHSRLARLFPDLERDARTVVLRGRAVRRRGTGSDGQILQLTLSPHRRDGTTVGVCGVLDIWSQTASISRRREPS